ncbi:MAG: Spy/CpxP family protein refolding chaperone [Elainellaceae cyanobacterium]
MNRFYRQNLMQRTTQVALVGGLAAIALGAFSISAQADPGRATERFRPALEALDLTDEQRDQIQAIREEAFDQVADILTPAQRQVASNAIASGEFRGVFRDMDLTLEQRDEIRAVFGEVREEVAEVLTEEQRQQIREGFQSRWGQRGGPQGRFLQR